MLRIKQHKFMCIGVIVLGLILLGMPAAYALDGQPPLPDSAADEITLQAQDALEEIAANREAVIIDLAERWADQSEESVASLSQTFDGATNEQLLAIDRADTYKEVLEVLGSITQDFVYTPVTPCKILDTRYGGGGFIYSGQTRNYFVHGNLAAQGGTTCTAPRGEPRAVHISMAAVTPNGQGNLKAFPYGASGTAGLTVNFAPIGTNLNNAGTVQTAYNVGSDIGVKSSYAGTHVTIQVLGYYYDAEPEKITAVDSATNTSVISVNSTSTWSTLVSKSVTIPYSGHVIITGESNFRNSGSPYLYCRFMENGLEIAEWDWDAGDADAYYDQRQTSTFHKAVSSGSKTYALQCRTPAGGSASAFFNNLIILFVKETM